MRLSQIKRTDPNSLLMVRVFLVANALKTAFMYLPFGQARDYHELTNHFLPAFFLASAVYVPLLQRKRRLLSLVVYLLQAAYLALNLGCYYCFHDLLHLNCLYDLKFESFEAVRTFSFTIPPLMYLVFLDLTAFLFILWRIDSTAALIRKITLLGKVPFYGTVLYFTCLFVGYATGAALPPESNHDEPSRHMAIVNRYGYIAHNINELLFESESTVNDATIVYGKRFKTAREHPIKSNIIMIQFESLDANIVDYRYKGEYVAPFLHELSNSCVYYPYTLCYRKAGGTSDCEIAVLNSIEPLTKSVTMHSEVYLYPNAVTKKLPKEYEIKAFHGNTGNFYHRDHAYRTMGFRDFYDRERMKLPEEGWGASDRNVMKFVERQLSDEQMPFFYYLITMSSHEPFTNVLHYFHNERFQDIDQELTRNYFTSISYVDKELREFLAYVNKYAPDTYVFIYGDHTPYVINDGPYRRAMAPLDGKDMEFVPLFIVTPGHTKYREQNRVASYLDLAPTLLAASGASASMLTPGTDLLRTPLQADLISHRGHEYSRQTLFDLIAETRASGTAAR